MYETKPYFYGTGRRKHSVARVRVYNGTGKVTINGRDIEDYFGLDTLKLLVRSPLVLTETDGKFDVVVNVVGGGCSVPRPAAVRPQPAPRPEEGRLPDPRSSYEGTQEIRPQGGPSRSAVQQALIGVSNWFKDAQKPRKTAVFRGFSISHLLFPFVCFWQDLNCSDPVFLD